MQCMQSESNLMVLKTTAGFGYAMTGVGLFFRAFSKLHIYSRICQKTHFITHTPQCSTCWKHQRHLSKSLTDYRLPANALFQANPSHFLDALSGNTSVYSSVRHKSKKSQKRNKPGSTEEEENEDEDEEVDPEDISDYEDEPEEDPTIPKDYKDVEKAVQSFRFDVIFTAGLDLSRHKVEEAFYDGKLRLNGEKLWKKSRTVKVGDILDLIVDEDRETASTTVMRTILKDVIKEKTTTDKYKVVIRRWKRLAISKAPEATKSADSEM
ncbi:mitochondrial transcription rescue factor 1-like isoform X1 [Hyperolius riggenbachi]|uniref:mitochondrial transcription rescue factor 1-like isoform X1 n=2 Tax=Hyperolius riggenbachi TaxID=752182 RepID=UPI0035A383E7